VRPPIQHLSPASNRPWISFVVKKSFVLDRDKAEAAFNASGSSTGASMAFNLLPLKYRGRMASTDDEGNHWEPEDIQMQADIQQWQGVRLPTASAGSSGWASLSAAKGSGDNIQHARTGHGSGVEARAAMRTTNIHADSLPYDFEPGINPHECEAMFEQIPNSPEE
jgi:ribonucleoside-diphosphate reductase beta chain